MGPALPASLTAYEAARRLFPSTRMTTILLTSSPPPLTSDRQHMVLKTRHAGRSKVCVPSVLIIYSLSQQERRNGGEHHPCNRDYQRHRVRPHRTPSSPPPPQVLQQASQRVSSSQARSSTDHHLAQQAQRSVWCLPRYIHSPTLRSLAGEAWRRR